MTELLLRGLLADGNVRLDSAIGQLVREGKLDRDTKQAADLLRLTGNDAVHPNELQIAGDDTKIGLSLFQLLNFLVVRLSTVPGQLQAMFDSLPEGKRQHIADRDQAPTAPCLSPCVVSMSRKRWKRSGQKLPSCPLDDVDDSPSHHKRGIELDAAGGEALVEALATAIREAALPI